MAEMITVRVIFWGLVALVPDADGRGAAVHIVNADQHTAMLTVEIGSVAVGSGEKFRGLRDDWAKIDIPWQLFWVYGKREWELSGEELRLDIPAKGFKLVRGVHSSGDFPENLEGSEDLRWLPRMNRLVSGIHEPINDGCLDRYRGCEHLAAARFLLRQGRISACHLLHKEDGATDKLYRFEFRRREGPFPLILGYKQALADAFVMEAEIPRDSEVSLLRRRYGDEEPTSVSIMPEDNQILIMIRNHPSCSNHKHFENFFRLARNPEREERFSHPRMLEGDGDVQNFTPAGTCESELTDYVARLSDFVKWARQEHGLVDDVFPVAYPHNQAECDAIYFDR